jgi:O-antigen ligase
MLTSDTNQIIGARPTLRRECTIALVETLICVAPAMAELYRGSPAMAARLLFGTTASVLFLNVLLRQPTRYMSLAMSVIPAILLMRTQFYFSSLIVIFTVGVLLWWSVLPSEVWNLWGNGVRLVLMIATTFYWAISWFNTGQYSSNIHAIEFSLVALGIYLLGGYRSALAAGLLGLGASTVLVAFGAFPYGDRLGLVRINSMSFGNPITLGLSAALIFLLCIAERGRWIGLDSFPTIRFLVSLVSAAILILSTSRGSWLMAVVGILIVFAIGREYRPSTIGVVLFVPVMAAVMALSTGRGDAVTKFYNKVASPDTSLGQKTTGRFNQWQRFPKAFAGSPLWGYGGGSGASIYHDVGGTQLQWHSLYLQLLVETGLIGFLTFMFALTAIGQRTREHRRTTGEIVPLLAVVCYLTIGMSVSAFDGISGVYLGLALIGGNSHGFWRMTQVVLRYEDPIPAPELLCERPEVRV